MEKLAPEQWLRPAVLDMSAYHVPPPGDAIKLDAMENPFAWPGALPESLRAEWAAGLAELELNRYPDAAASELSVALRDWLQLADNTGLMLGNGSDELIQLLMIAAGNGCVMAPEPTFVMYRHLALCCGLEFVGVPLNADDFSLDLPAMLAAVEREQPKLIFLAYPNNPTGNRFDRDAVLQIIQASPGLVVVDEAYAAFAADSLLDALPSHDNLLLMRTLSKIGLAGLRLGLLAGATRWIEQLDKLRLPYNINTLTQFSAIFALRHRQVLDEQATLLREERQRLFVALSERSDAQVWPSEANFLTFRVPDAVQTHQRLLDEGVLIKRLHGAHPALEQCLRVTVGTAEENQRFLHALG